MLSSVCHLRAFFVESGTPITGVIEVGKKCWNIAAFEIYSTFSCNGQYILH